MQNWKRPRRYQYFKVPRKPPILINRRCGRFFARILPGSFCAEFTCVTGLSLASVFADLALTNLAFSLPALPGCSFGIFLSGLKVQCGGVGSLISGGTLGNLLDLKCIQNEGGVEPFHPPFISKLF